MDYSSLIITIAILLYGLFEYRRRDQRHRIDMEFLRRKIQPPPDSDLAVPLWRMITVGITACIVLGAVGFLTFEATKHPGNLAPLSVIAFVFLSLEVPLVIMILRDSRAPRGKLRRNL